MTKKAKLIHLTESVEQGLSILAVKAKKDLKNYIQDLLTEHAKAGDKILKKMLHNGEILWREEGKK